MPANCLLKWDSICVKCLKYLCSKNYSINRRRFSSAAGRFWSLTISPETKNRPIHTQSEKTVMWKRFSFCAGPYRYIRSLCKQRAISLFYENDTHRLFHDDKVTDSSMFILENTSETLLFVNQIFWSEF